MPKARNSKVDEALALYRQGLKLIEISRKLDIPEGTVRRWKCTYKWDAPEETERSQPKKPNARKRGGQPGNKNATGPPGNKNAEKFGFLSKYLPEETLELLHLTADSSPLDLLWTQIQLAYAAIIRAQKIAYVKDAEDKTIEKIEDRSGAESWGEKWEVQQAWDKQANFMKAQARAQSELRGLIKQYDEMLHKDWEAATEEQKARLQVLKAKLNDGSDRISDLIIPKFWPAFNDREHTHKILTSGRAGTKSSAAAIEVVYKIVSEEDCSAVVIRKRHNKLRKTVYKEIKRAIKRLGLDKRQFKITVSPMEITYKPNGNTIYFTGSDSIDDTKGIIDESKPIKIVLLDEVSEFFTDGEGEDELQNIEATFIRGNAEGFQMLYLYNPPKNPNAPVVVWCRKMEKRPDCIHVHVDYRDVPPEWLGAKLIEAAEILREVDERQWRWLWLGLSIGVDELIYYMFGDAAIQRPSRDHYRIIGVGVDYGQQNATTYQAAGLNESLHRLEGLGEYYHSGRESGTQKSPSEYAKDFVEFLDELHETYSCSYFYTFIDPSARGLMEEIKRATRGVGYNVLIRDAENDVALGISRVQKLLTFKMMTVSPDQENAVREFGLYEYDKKSIERGREEPVKQDDHGMDAIRYLVMGMWSKIKNYLPVRDKEEEPEGVIK